MTEDAAAQRKPPFLGTGHHRAMATSALERCLPRSVWGAWLAASYLSGTGNVSAAAQVFLGATSVFSLNVVTSPQPSVTQKSSGEAEGVCQ